MRRVARSSEYSDSLPASVLASATVMPTGEDVPSDDDVSKNQTTILIHYYRAMVGRADVWRTRMDTTTNWAIGSTAAILSFTLSDDSVPHYVVSIAPLMTMCFLLLEARRLTFYNLFQQRVLLLEDGLIRKAAGLADSSVDVAPDPKNLSSAGGSGAWGALDGHLGRTRPTMPLVKAAARRMRRVYLYLFAIQLLAWGFKLAGSPGPARSMGEVISRAKIGLVPGGAVLGIIVLLWLAAVGMAFGRGGVDRDPA